MLVDMYLARLRDGSVSTHEQGVIISDRDGVLVLDGRHALGLLIADQAAKLAVERARRHGAGVVAVRHGFHFGVARRFAVAMAQDGCAGIAMCNTRPLMPAPGGAERIVGNNPIAIAIPSAGPTPLVLDMATSEAAMGKIRNAAKAGQAIPPNWAVAGDGSPTTDPDVAIKGMLLPSAGPKGFGLSFMIDMLCGLLSGGAHGDAVTPLYGDPSVPYNCSMLFLAIDVAQARGLAEFEARAEAAAERVRNGRRAAGVNRLYTPGSLEWLRRREAAGQVRLGPAVVDMLINEAARFGINAASLLAIQHDRKDMHHGQA
jgi:LDH2 family malate/lactate/ureidoglycolate dehydrogenase